MNDETSAKRGYQLNPPPASTPNPDAAPGPPTRRRRDRFHPCRQRLPAHRRLAARADPRRSPLARLPASHPGSLCPAVLSGARRLRSVLPLEFHAYHWSFMQVEYATDLVFRSQAILKPLYEQLSRQAILTVKAEHVATFLGHKITPQLAQEIASQFTTRIEGTCVKHRFGRSSIKIYDKFALVLRIETTTNDISAFKHYRKSLPPRRRGWNIGTARQPAALPPSERPSTASTTCVRSCSVAIVAISNTSPVWTTSRLASGRSTVSPNPVPSKAATSTAATFSAATNGPCSRPCNVQASTSPASAAPTSCCGSPNALLQPSPDNALVCAISASSNASPALIATISPALAAPPSPPAAASPNTP